MTNKKRTVKQTYNNIRIIWILIYLAYMLFFGFISYQSIHQKLDNRTSYLVNLFDTLYNQNAIQMVSNPENYKRVIVSDIEGEVLLQYGELIPALTHLDYNTLFNRLKTDKIVLSNFYEDPIIETVCFDMGIIEKNRIYIGTLSVLEFLRNNLENLALDEFLILDSNHNGYLFTNEKIVAVNTFKNEPIRWINHSLFLSDKSLYFSHRDKLNNFQYITYLPFMPEVMPLFLLSMIPFVSGLIIIFLIEHMEKRKKTRKKGELERQMAYIIEKKAVPESLQKTSNELTNVFFRTIDDQLTQNKNNKKAMKRYVEKLSTSSEQLMDIKNDLEYFEKYFYNLMNQDDLDFAESIKSLFQMAFEKMGTYHTLILKIDHQTIYHKEREGEESQEKPKTDAFIKLDLGKHVVDYYVALEPNQTVEFSDIRKSVFELLSGYTALIYSVKKGLNPAELSLTKNFSVFSEMVNREIEKVKRYQETGMLFYLEILNYSMIKEKYGISVAKIILKRVSEIITSKVRTSDIVGLYREGQFLVYFCNLDESDAKPKINQIGNSIYQDKKILQIGINIELKSIIVAVEKTIQNFDDLLLKCFQQE